MPEMVFELFEVELQNILYNLFDPAYLPDAQLYPIFQLSGNADPDALRQKIVEAIEALRSNTSFSQHTKADQLSEILSVRFIRGYSQERAAEVLGLSARHLRRKQNEAIHALATRVWQAHQRNGQELPTEPASQEQSWKELMTHELELLRSTTSESSADLAEAFQRVSHLAAYLPGIKEAHLSTAPTPAGIRVPVPPAVLQQVLLNIITHLVQNGYQGQLRLSSRADEEGQKVCLELDPAPAAKGLEMGSLEALTGMLGAELRAQAEGPSFVIQIVFGATRQVTVLVVDDNSQVVHLYQRYCANTRYNIAHMTSGAGLMERLAESPVDVLMIDVLLPDVDGWELLLQLHCNPKTANIPVIICSVLGSKEMAATLGAAGFLSKPIERKALLGALDEISAGRRQLTPPAQTPK
jgi:CheY-like chemotaxis protein